MASEPMTARDNAFVLVSLTPDVCWTPIGDKAVPVPYPITHTMAQAQQCSTNVYLHQQPAFLHERSYVDHVQGDEAGSRGGIVSGVHRQVSHSRQHSHSVYVNGQPIVRAGDTMLMNARRPG